jgi:hypothetical protein
MSFTQIRQALTGVDCTNQANAVWCTFNPTVKANIGNLTVNFGLAPVDPPNPETIPLSIALFNGVLNTFQNGLNFNFSIGQGLHSQNDFVVVFNITDQFNQILYYADMSGLVP